MKKLVLMFGILVGVVNAQITGDRLSELMFECVAKGDKQACKSLIDSGFIGEAYGCGKRGMRNLGGTANMHIGNKDKAVPYYEELINLDISQRKQDFVFITMTTLGANEKEVLELQDGAYIDLLEYYADKNKSLGGNNEELLTKIIKTAILGCLNTTNKQVIDYTCALTAHYFLIAESYHEAFRAAKKGCEANVKREEAYEAFNNCSIVGVLYERGKGVHQDYAKAGEYYKNGCDLGYADSCGGLGDLYMQGKGVSRNRSIAKRLFGKACDLGEQEECNKYRELNQAGVQ